MSGFDTGWLALREPADRAARDPLQVQALGDFLRFRTEAGAGPARLLDIGCGTGSTWRSLSSALPAGTSWQLLDYDQALLDEAQRRIGGTDTVTFRQHDLTDLDALPLDGVDAVTASALFDLCSEHFCRDFAARIADAGTGFYAALNYDGEIAWSLPHPLDATAVESFNRHQQTDKGFGMALGPQATACLAKAFSTAGYRVLIGDSPWRLGPEASGLQAAFLNGMRRPLGEIGLLTDTEIDDWLAFRHAAVAETGSTLTVGHQDLLALPPA